MICIREACTQSQVASSADGSFIIPRSRDTAHLAENIDLFGWELQHADMKELGWRHDNEACRRGVQRSRSAKDKNCTSRIKLQFAQS